MEKIREIEDCFREILGTISISELVSNARLIEQATLTKAQINAFKKE